MDLSATIRSQYEEKGLSNKKFHRYLKTYFEAMNSMNIRSMASISTDLYYHSLESMLRYFAKLGLRREIALKTSAKDYGCLRIAKLGNIDWITQEISGSYKEHLVDSQTNKVLMKKKYDDCSFSFSLNRNPDRQIAGDLYCLGCGNLLQSEAALLICPHCATTYTSDSYEWTISDASAKPPVTKSWTTRLATIVSTPFYLLPVFAFVAMYYEPLTIYVLIGNIILFVGSIFYFFFAANYYKAFRKIQKIDPNFNPMRMTARVEYLLRLLIQNSYDNKSLLRQFMDEKAYETYLGYDESGKTSFTIDFKPTMLGYFVKNYSIRNARQHVHVNIMLKLTKFDTQTRKLQKKKHKLQIGLYRNEGTICKDQFTPEAILCTGCGMSVNMTAHGKCRYCGTTYDVADYDWKIEMLDESIRI